MTVYEFLSQPMWQRLAITLVHFVWQGLLVAALVSATIRLFRVSSGHTRYATYISGFFALMACPIITFSVLNMPPVLMLQVTPSVDHASVVLPVSAKEEVVLDKKAMASKPKIATHPDAIAPQESATYAWDMVLPWALLVWIIGVLVLSVRLLLGFIGIHRFKRDLEPMPHAMKSRIALLCEKLGLSEFSRVFKSPYVTQAMVVGCVRPMILLPVAMVSHMSPDMLEAVIAHELAHIRRFDLWVNLLQRITETVLFYHPAVWWLSSRIRNERELCCDDLAVRATGERLAYASALQQAVKMARQQAQPVLAMGLGKRPGKILNRVQHVLGITTPEKNNHFWQAGVAGIALLATMAFMASDYLTAAEQSLDEEGNHTATLVGGATVELTGVTRIPMTVPGRVGAWWRPDGALLHDPLFDSLDFKCETFEDWEAYAFYAVALKFHINPINVKVTKWEAPEALYADSVLAKQRSRWVYQDGICVAAIQFPKTVKKTTLRVGFESGQQSSPLEWIEFKDVALRLGADGVKEIATLGRIVGQLSADAKPAEGRIGLLGLPHMDYGVPGNKRRGAITADANGVFVIEDISPGWYELGYMVQSSGFTNYRDEQNLTGGSYSSSYTDTIRKPIQVKTGETLQVTLGFEGRDVVGRFVLPEESPYQSIPLGVLNGVEAFYTAHPKIQENRPAQYDQMSRKEQQQWRQQWYKSEAYLSKRRAQLTSPNRRHYVIPVQNDGSFRIKHVIPGTYELYFYKESHKYLTQFGPLSVASFREALTIPPPDPGKEQEAFDLGKLEVKTHEFLEVGQVAPDFEVETMDGRTIRLSDQKGQAVLIYFQSEGSNYGMEEIKEAHEAYPSEDRLLIIGMHADLSRAELEDYLKENVVNWPVVHLGPSADSEIMKYYRDVFCPSYFLIDGEGKIVAGYHFGGMSRLANALARTLKAE